MSFRQLTFVTSLGAVAIAAGLAAPASATDLFDAVRAHDAGRVFRLLSSGADPNVRSPYDGPLHVAARFGTPEMVAGLLKAGADIELPGYGGMRPLHAAAMAGQQTALGILLEHGAQVDSIDNIGRTPLLSMVSGSVGNLGTLKRLLEAGANPNLSDDNIGYHALDYAAIQGRADTAEILLAFGADANAKDNLRGKTPLHFAIAACLCAVGGHLDVVRVLIANGANVNATDAEGLTPMEYANRYAPNNGMLHIMLTEAGAK